MDRTGADAVMVGETALHNPYIFQGGTAFGARADFAAQGYLQVCERSHDGGPVAWEPPVSWARAHVLRLWRKFIALDDFRNVKVKECSVTGLNCVDR